MTSGATEFRGPRPSRHLSKHVVWKRCRNAGTHWDARRITRWLRAPGCAASSSRAARRRKRQQNMRPRPSSRRVHERGSSALRICTWMHDQQQRSAARGPHRALRAAGDRRRPRSARNLGHAPPPPHVARSPPIAALRGIGDERARSPSRPWSSTSISAAGAGGSPDVVGDVFDTDAVARREVPRVRGSVRLVAVMEESAHATRICNRDDERIPSMNRGDESRSAQFLPIAKPQMRRFLERARGPGPPEGLV